MDIWFTNGYFFSLLLLKDLHQNTIFIKTSLLRKMQAQTLPDATTPIGQIYPFTKMTATVEPVMRF